MAWQRLIRFEDHAGQERLGEPSIESIEEFYGLLEHGDLIATEMRGEDLFALTPTGEKHKVKKLLGLLKPSDVPIVKCIGLNYMKHSKLFARPPPPLQSLN